MPTRASCSSLPSGSSARAIWRTSAGPIDVIAIDADGTSLPGEARCRSALGAAGRETRRSGVADVHVGHYRQAEGVMLTQANLAENALAISREHQLSSADRVAAVLPLYHINAFAVTMLAPLAHGGSLVMPPKFSVAGFWEMAIARLHVAQRRADDHFVFARRRGARTWTVVAHSLLPLGFRCAATGTPSRVRSEVRHRHRRNDGSHRDSGSSVLESDRAATAQDRIGRESVGLRGARGRRRRRTACRWNCRRDRDSRAAGHAGLLQKCGSDCSRILSRTVVAYG